MLEGNIRIRGNDIKPKPTDIPWSISAVSSGDIYQISLNADKHTVTFRHKKKKTKTFKNYG